MVLIVDEGSEFDAPLTRIWEYVRSPEQHKHTRLKVLNRELVGDNMVIITNEFDDGSGKPIRNKVRNTVYPPLGTVQEFLEGPLAGSKAFLHYTPKGKRTGVSVVGEYVGAGMDEKAVKKAVMAMLEVVFNEDNANLKKLK